MLGPDRGVIDVSPEVPKAVDRRGVPTSCKAYAWDEPSAVYFTSVRAFDEPLMSALVEHGTVDMLVV